MKRGARWFVPNTSKLHYSGKVYAGVMVCRIAETQIQEEQRGFCRGNGMVILVLEGGWDFPLSVHMYFMDLQI